MIDSIKTFLLVIILIYSIVITVLYWTEYTNKQQYLQDKSNNLNNKEIELNRREKSTVDKEVCFIELTKLQTIQNSALNLLKSYENSYLQNIPTMKTIQPQISQEITQSSVPKIENENSWITTLSNIINS